MKKIKNAFTLIELLAVLVLLAVLSLVIVPPLVSQMQKMRKDLSESQKKLIYNAAETYILKNKNEYPTIEGTKYCLSLKQLVHAGLLEDKIINHLEDTEIGLDMTIAVTVDSKVSYSFSFDPKTAVCIVP